MQNPLTSVDNNSAANIRPPSPTQEQVRQAAAAQAIHPVDVVDSGYAPSAPSSRPASPSLSEGLQSPRGISRASTPAMQASVSEELEGSYVEISDTSSETSQATEKTMNLAPAPKEQAQAASQDKGYFGFASRVTNFFSSLGHKVQSGVEAAEHFLATAKATFVDIGKSIIDAVNKMITALSPR